MKVYPFQLPAIPRIFRHSGVLAFGVLLGLCACGSEDANPTPVKEYGGPMMEVDTIETLYSDSARLVVKMNAARQLKMFNGDEMYPKGVNIVFYDKDGTVSATLRSDRGKYKKETNLYTVYGNVVVVDEKKGQTIRTEALNWSPVTKKIHTDKFVTITTPTEVLKGYGLNTSQDFSAYEIQKPTGIFDVKQ
ncbi:MAG: LPS export ABC transporter periplasmic protein LptC [Ferruginibacter sp.]|nr:LPS export ABC transporter periplasmic protein LptC [Cytophagales bacterium]